MAVTAQNLKQSLDTVFQLIVANTEKYPLDDQVLLTEFLAVLEGYAKIDVVMERKVLVKRFQDYIRFRKNSQTYFQFPFLWFTTTFLANASQLLEVWAKTYPAFYEYILYPLRGYQDQSSMFQLIQQHTPLTDPAWEQLRFACNRLRDPLTEIELATLKATYACVLKYGLYMMKPARLTKELRTVLRTHIRPLNLARLYSRVNARWSMDFHPQAFGLTHIYFYFQVGEKTSIESIIDFQDKENTTLCMSRIYQIRDSPQSYTGTMVVPSYLKDALSYFLQTQEKEGRMILYELAEITTHGTSWSLNNYDRGWGELTKKQLPGIIISSPFEGDPDSFFFSPFFDCTWSYLQHSDPPAVIVLMCKAIRDYTYRELPLHHDRPKFTESEIALFRDLMDKKVLRLDFRTDRLVETFSPWYYQVRLNQISEVGLFALFPLFPSVHIQKTTDHHYLWTRLTSRLASWLQSKYGFEVKPIIEYHHPHTLNHEWFDTDTLQWRPPRVLNQTTFI